MESPNKARSDFLNDLMPFVIAVTRIDRLLWSKHGWQLLGELRIRLWIPGRNRPGLLRESVQSQREARQAASHSGEETEPPRGPGVWHPSVRHTRSGSSAKNRALQPPQHSQVSMETLGQIAYQRRFEKYSEFSVWALWPLSLFRLLNVSAGWQNQKFDLMLVFEYIDQDLTTFLSKASAKGLARDKIKVWTLLLSFCSGNFLNKLVIVLQ